MNQENHSEEAQKKHYDFLLVAMVGLMVGGVVFALFDVAMSGSEDRLLRQVRTYYQANASSGDLSKDISKVVDIYGYPIKEKARIDKDGKYVLNYVDGIVYIAFSKPNTFLAKRVCPKLHENYAVCLPAK